MPSPFLSSGKLRPTGEIREILQQRDNLPLSDFSGVFAEFRKRRPELVHITDKQLGSIVRAVLSQTPELGNGLNDRHADTIKHKLAIYIKELIEQGHCPSAVDIIDHSPFGLKDQRRNSALMNIYNAFKSLPSAIEIVAELYVKNLQAGGLERHLHLESCIEESPQKNLLPPPSAEIIALQEHINGLVQNETKTRHTIRYIIRHTLFGSFAPAKRRARTAYYRQCEQKFREAVFYFAVRSGYRLAYSEEIRAIMQTSERSGIFLTCREISHLADITFGEQPELKSKNNKINAILKIVAQTGYPLETVDLKRPDSVLGKLRSFMLTSDKIVTRRQIVGALYDQPWQFERLNQAKREILYTRAYVAASEIKRPIAPPTLDEVIAQLLADAYLAGREITNSKISARLRDKRVKMEINQKGNIETACINKIREPLELSLFAECATGPLKTIAKALKKFPTDYMDEEVRLMRAMVQAVLPDYPAEQLTKERLQRITYQGYNPKVRVAFKTTEYKSEILLASLRLIPLAARCVFTHAKNNEKGILFWYKAPPPPTDEELLAKDAHRGETKLTRRELRRLRAA